MTGEASSARGYKNYLLTLLLVLLAVNLTERWALGLLAQDIKRDLQLTDTELGLLSGLAFAVFYSAIGVPIARWADRGNRVTIISITMALWGVMVALCGTVSGFVQLLLVRVGVAVGEAGCVPPAHSLIAEYFTRAQRPRAVAIFMLGAPLSMMIGYFISGWMNELYGWRVTFGLLGAPGLLLALVAALTLKEPRQERSARGEVPSSGVPQTGETRFRDVLSILWRNRTFRQLLFCFALCSFFSSGISQWQPAFFIRSYGMKTGELGTWLALIYGLGGVLGTYVGGELASRYAAHNERLQLRAIALVLASFGLLSFFIYLKPSYPVALGLLAFVGMSGYVTNGPMFATIQTLVPEHMRAMSIALIYFSANLIGMGLGPLAAGALSDAFRPWFADDSLRYALLVLCPGYFWGAWHLWRGSQTVTADLEAAASR